jgi:hypothetical protein
VPQPGHRRRRNRRTPGPGGHRAGAPCLAAGILAQAARVSLRAAFHDLHAGRILLSQPAAATITAAILTAAAVHAAG